tara:strand:+ start:287 stop:1873 length:1587 start_codon:yes stop_codon:yes gene_type:complete
MMNPDMMKAAQEMMAKMSPDDMNRMMEMSKNMDPSMMAQAQSMMNNPAMAQQAAAQMKSMSADDMKAKLNQVPGAMGGGAPKPAAPTTVVAKLKASAMDISQEVVDLAEQAEKAKTQGNANFKSGNYTAAAAEYDQGSGLVAQVLGKKALSGADKQAVVELKDACHLNLANCRLKLEEWEAAAEQCVLVLDRGGKIEAGSKRKALFRRGQARVKQERLQEALDDLTKARDLDRSDTIVAGMLKDVEGKLGIESVETPAAKAPAPAASSAAAMGMPPGMPSDPAEMERMLDQISPEQMQQQAAMLESMDPAQLQAMAPQLGGMDAEQVKMAGKMMAGMDPEQMKQMARMAQQMGMGPGGAMPGMAGGGAGGASGTGSSSVTPACGSGAAAAAGMPAGMGGMDMSNMSMDKGLDMMKGMSPEMMKAGMDMMKNMDPKMMASMSKMMGREVSETEMERMQSMMSDMKPEDMEKWAGRAQTVAKVAEKPLQLFRSSKETIAKVGGGSASAGLLAIVVGLLAVLAFGHVTATF